MKGFPPCRDKRLGKIMMLLAPPAPLVGRAIKRRGFPGGSNDTLITRQRGRQIKFRVRKLARARGRARLFVAA